MEKFLWRTTVVALALPLAMTMTGICARAQQAPDAPMAPAPGHEVHRIGNTPTPAAPPPIPAGEIISKFSQKENDFLAARVGYGFRKTVRIDEFSPDGKQIGQYLSVSDVVMGENGRAVVKVVEKPQSTLHYFNLETEDVRELDRIPPFPMTTSQVPKYDFTYLGTEQVDEINCYIFQVKPKSVNRESAYFDGIVWVDTQDLELVKTYGKWENELGDVHISNLPFTMFETYRENVGEYWFPNYERSDDTLHLKDVEVPVRLVIKWENFKPLAETQAATPAAKPGVNPSGPGNENPAANSPTTSAPAPSPNPPAPTPNPNPPAPPAPPPAAAQANPAKKP